MFFGLGKKQGCLGIDLGSTSIKVVELRKEKGAPTLVTYGYAERAMGDVVKGGSEEIQRKTTTLLKKLCLSAETDTLKTTTALPNFAVFTSVITLPVMKRSELDKAIHWETKKYIPLPIEEVVLDWQIVERGRIEGQKKEVFQILLTAASKTLIQRYVEIFRQADLELESLETEAFALARALTTKKEEIATMILDTSAATTDVIILKKGIPILTRSIEVGGVTISRFIAEAMKIEFEKAEQFKRDIGLLGLKQMPDILEKIIQPIIDEVRYSLKLYESQYNETVEKIILSGGSSYLMGFPEYLSEALKMRVFVGDPWAKIRYPEELKPVLEEIAPRFSVAIGLALRGIE